MAVKIGLCQYVFLPLLEAVLKLNNTCTTIVRQCQNRLKDFLILVIYLIENGS